ncbi:MAG TPA: hypothetical protein DFR83_14655, partial [Deltaproteobacteria bacterium]|nr:hypothetical protein [Deltaproteobacteria bacterium]
MRPLNLWRFTLVAPAVLAACGVDSSKDPSVGVDGLSEYVDEDADGFTSQEDCNDSDPAVNPAGTEICDGIDNNCDGVIDEGVTDPFWPDMDGDGFGDMDAPAVDACAPPANHSNNANDCNDADSAYNPAAIEDDCTDPNDYNCDGSV